MSQTDCNLYFDWAATSPADSEILRESLEISLLNYANPSSAHKAGLQARTVLENARESCAKTLGVKKNQIFFTSGGTESDHLPLLSVLNKSTKGRVILSGIEHPALREECAKLKTLGFDVVSVNPDKNGFVSPESVAEKLTGDTLFVTVMAVNNETGCVQPIYEIADKITELTQGKRRPHFHVDCVQAAGKVPLNLSHPGIDSAALSAHKICGPRGIGILYASKEFRSFLVGGGQEQNIRSGTENLFGAVAFSKVLEKYYLREDSNLERFEEQKKWTKEFLGRIKDLKGCSIVPEIRANLEDDSVQEKFSPWVVQAAFHGIPGNVMVRALDAKGISISTGSACSTKKQERPVLAAMNASRDVQDTAVRFSFGPLTTHDGMNTLFEAISEIVATFN